MVIVYRHKANDGYGGDMGDVITIRRSKDEDATAIGQLAQLDSQAAPEGDALLAFVDDELLAAVPLDGGRAVADPFHRTAEVVDLLKLRAGQDRSAA
jgi:hypothetical protein